VIRSSTEWSRKAGCDYSTQEPTTGSWSSNRCSQLRTAAKKRKPQQSPWSNLNTSEALLQDDINTYLSTQYWQSMWCVLCSCTDRQ